MPLCARLKGGRIRFTPVGADEPRQDRLGSWEPTAPAASIDDGNHPASVARCRLGIHLPESRRESPLLVGTFALVWPLGLS